MMILTKEQIKNFIDIVGQPNGSILLNSFFKKYSKYLNSSDVSELYDEEYSMRILKHPVYIYVDRKFPINIYTRYSYEYIMQSGIESKRILDIGCGSGDFAHALSFQGAKVVGIDFNPFFIAKANKIAAKYNLNCDFYCEDINDKIFNCQFDYVVLNDVTEHLSDDELDRLFKTIIKLLNSNGKIIIHTPNGLALCNETDSSFIQKLYIKYLKMFKNYKGFSRTPEQVYYDQVHINIKSHRQLRSFLKQYALKDKVYYDSKKFNINFLDAVFSSNFLMVCEKK